MIAVSCTGDLMKLGAPRTDLWDLRQHIPLGTSGMGMTLSDPLSHIISQDVFWNRNWQTCLSCNLPVLPPVKSKNLKIIPQSTAGKGSWCLDLCGAQALTPGFCPGENKAQVCVCHVRADREAVWWVGDSGFGSVSLTNTLSGMLAPWASISLAVNWPVKSSPF